MIETFRGYGDELDRLGTREYPMMNDNLVYPAMGVAGEAGELLDKIKKHWRNTNHEIMRRQVTPDPDIASNASMTAATLTVEQRVEIVKEMGDVLWYLWAMCEELGISLADVATENVAKLRDRKRRDKICSEGDNR